MIWWFYFLRHDDNLHSSDFIGLSFCMYQSRKLWWSKNSLTFSFAPFRPNKKITHNCKLFYAEIWILCVFMLCTTCVCIAFSSKIGLRTQWEMKSSTTTLCVCKIEFFFFWDLVKCRLQSYTVFQQTFVLTTALKSAVTTQKVLGREKKGRITYI